MDIFISSQQDPTLSLASRHLIFHGALVLLYGLCLGAPYARAVNRGAPAEIVHAWRVAHASLPMGAILMLAVAALLPSLAVGEILGWGLVAALVVSAYAFCISTTLAALTGQRGLNRSLSRGWGRVVHAANMLGAAISLLAAVLLVLAAAASLG
jgi:hypothetical protein